MTAKELVEELQRIPGWEALPIVTSDEQGNLYESQYVRVVTHVQWVDGNPPSTLGEVYYTSAAIRIS